MLQGHTARVTGIRWRIKLGYLLVFCADGDCFVWQLATGMLERRVRTTPSVASPHLAPALAALPLAAARHAIASGMPVVTEAKLRTFRRCTRSAPIIQVRAAAAPGQASGRVLAAAPPPLT